jgi:splicing factor U2AF subunit
LDDDPPTDYECDWKAKIKDSKIYEDPNLPKDIKDKYAYLENNPYAMIISNTPYNIQLRGLEEYFNTLITSLA